jgi:hypothetical protein
VLPIREELLSDKDHTAMVHAQGLCWYIMKFSKSQRKFKDQMAGSICVLQMAAAGHSMTLL